MKSAVIPGSCSLAGETVLRGRHCSCPNAQSCSARPLSPPGPVCPPPQHAPQALHRAPSDDDHFHLNCVVAQVWLVQLRRYIETRYLQSPNAARQPLQTGYALFEPPGVLESVRLFENLLRFANYEHAAPARTFFLAYAPVVFEHDLSGEFIGPGVGRPEPDATDAAVRVRRTLRRWCDWLEALIHFQIHERHSLPLSSLELDRAIIFLWPLVLRYKWNSVDLLIVLRTLVNRSTAFPCQSANQLAQYGRAGLGLRVPSRKTAAVQGLLPGRAVAERLLRFLNLGGAQFPACNQPGSDANAPLTTTAD
jgi:hypothetical protein